MSRTRGQFPRQTHELQFLEIIKYKSNEIGYNFHNLRFRLRENQTPVDFFQKNTHNLVLFQQKFIEIFHTFVVGNFRLSTGKFSYMGSRPSYMIESSP